VSVLGHSAGSFLASPGSEPFSHFTLGTYEPAAEQEAMDREGPLAIPGIKNIWVFALSVALQTSLFTWLMLKGQV
jgi:hypothetical protein